MAFHFTLNTEFQINLILEDGWKFRQTFVESAFHATDIKRKQEGKINRKEKVSKIGLR